MILTAEANQNESRRCNLIFGNVRPTRRQPPARYEFSPTPRLQRHTDDSTARPPHAERVQSDERVLICEGHDLPRTEEPPTPETVHQPMRNPGGTPTQNGLFYEAAVDYKSGKREPALVEVYEKLHPGIWVYSGFLRLLHAGQRIAVLEELPSVTWSRPRTFIPMLATDQTSIEDVN